MDRRVPGYRHSPDKLVESPVSRSYHGIPTEYEARLSCEYHFHQVLSCSTPSQSSGTSKHVRNLIGILNYGLFHTDHTNSVELHSSLSQNPQPLFRVVSLFLSSVRAANRRHHEPLISATRFQPHRGPTQGLEQNRRKWRWPWVPPLPPPPQGHGMLRQVRRIVAFFILGGAGE